MKLISKDSAGNFLPNNVKFIQIEYVYNLFYTNRCQPILTRPLATRQEVQCHARGCIEVAVYLELCFKMKK